MSQLAYFLKSSQSWSSQSEVAQWTGKDAETATCSVGSGSYFELPLQVSKGTQMNIVAVSSDIHDSSVDTASISIQAT